MTFSTASAVNPSRRSFLVSLRRVSVIEWSALALGCLAMVLAVVIGAGLALIVEGSEASQEAKNERQCCDPDRSTKDARAYTPNRPVE